MPGTDTAVILEDFKHLVEPGAGISAMSSKGTAELIASKAQT
jgi:hypothetical protein